MSASHINLDCLPSLCRKLSELVAISRSYDKNNFACFLRHGVDKLTENQGRLKLVAREPKPKPSSYYMKVYGQANP